MDKHQKKNIENPATKPSLPALTRPLATPAARPPAAVEPPEEGMSPRKLLTAVLYWWKWALPAGIVLGVSAALLVRALFTPQYQAIAWLRIEEEAPYLAFETKDGAGRSKGFVQTQIELIRSPMVLGPVVAGPAITTLPELKDQDNPIEWLERNVSIKAIGQSELYTIGLTCSQPKAAADVVNSVLDSYFRLRAAEHGQRIERVIKILDLERTSRVKDVETLRNGVRSLAQQITGKDPFQTAPDRPPAEAFSLADLQNRLITMEVEESILQAKISAFEKFDPKSQATAFDAQIEQAVASNPQLAGMRQSLADKKARLNTFASQAVKGTEDPTYQRVAKVVAEEEHAFEQLKADLREQEKLNLEAHHSGQLGGQLAAWRVNLEDRRITREHLQKQYDELKSRTKQSTGDTVSLRFKQEELARAERVLGLISERIVQLETEKGAPPRVWEMKRADVPVTPVKDAPYLNMLLALVIGLGAPFGLAVLKEQVTARVHDPDLLERHAKLAVLGEIAQLPTHRRGLDRPGPRELRAASLFEESVDAMRTNLLLSAGPGTLRCIAVASAMNEEGKTTVAVQLASSIARACGVRTLIIDGDLRDPSIHSVFEVPREPGLTNVLAGEISLRAAISVTRAEGVDVLPAGVLRVNPHALLANGSWEALLRQIPSEYRYVIIDTPPVLAASESLVLVSCVDSVLMCALRDVTRLPQLQKATARVRSTRAPIGGLILNGIPTSHYASRYGTYTYLLER